MLQYLFMKSYFCMCICILDTVDGQESQFQVTKPQGHVTPGVKQDAPLDAMVF